MHRRGRWRRIYLFTGAFVAFGRRPDVCGPGSSVVKYWSVSTPLALTTMNIGDKYAIEICCHWSIQEEMLREVVPCEGRPPRMRA